MNRSWLPLLMILLILPLPLAAAEGDLTIIHTNDLHSHLQGFSPEIDYTPATTGDDRTVGGWARIATVIRQEKIRAAEHPVLVLDAGDFLMGSLFHLAGREEAFELRLMKDMGYDAVTLGNHEFDLRPDGLARIIQAAQTKGGLPELVSANIQFSPGDPRDTPLRLLATGGAIKPYTMLTRGGMRIGIFGIMGRDATEVAPFATPVHFADPIDTAREMVKLLREREKADVVICLSHCGWNKIKSPSEDELLAENVPGIDIIIGGHTHTALTRPIIAGNTIIVQAGAYGTYAGVLKVRREKNRVALSDYRLVAIDDSVPGDAAIQKKIESYAAVVDRDILRTKGLSARTVIAHTAFDLNIQEEESNLGNLIADSIRWYANRHDYDPRDPATKIVVALESNGVIRDDLLKGRTGNVTVSDAFRAVPLGIGTDDTPGYPLLSCYLTAQEIKKMLEIITSVYPRKGPTYFLQISGLTFTYNPWRMIFDRVTNIRMGSDEEGYAPLDYSGGNKKLYRVAANIYNAAFLKVVGDYTWHLLDIVPKDRRGAPIGDLSLCRIDADKSRNGIQELKEWTGFLDYLKSFPDTDGDGIPDIPQKYRGQLGRITRQTSLNPLALVARPGTTTTIALAGGALLVLFCLLAAFLVRKRKRRP